MQTAEAKSPDQSRSTLRVVLLKDQDSLVQTIVASDTLLDLNTIHRQTGRELNPVNPQELMKLAEGHRLKPLAGIPFLFQLETLIDEEVFNSDLQFGFECLVTAQQIHSDVSRDLLETELLNARQDFSPMPICIEVAQIPITGSRAATEELLIASVKTFTNLRMKQRLEETLEIPTLPQTAQQIIQLRVNPNAVVSQLSEIVESDPSLAAQVVSWAASPYYAVPGKIRSVQDAIVRVLGFDLVGNLALGLALGKTLNLPNDKAAGKTPYWQQAIYCSTLVEALVKLLPLEKRPSKGLMYLSGLLHNFGYLVVAHIFPPQFSQICRYMEANPHISHMAIEQHLLEITREQICAWLMQLWNMPNEVASAITHQHNPEYDDDDCCYPNLVYMALRLLRQQGIGDAPLEDIPQALFDKYEMDRDKVNETVQMILESDENIKLMAENFPS